MNHAFYNLFLEDSALNLWEFEDDADQSSQVTFSINADLLTLIKTRKCNLDDVFVQKQVLRLFVSEDYHKRLNKSIS